MAVPVPEPSVWALHDTRGFGSLLPSGCGYYRVVLPFTQLAIHGWHAGYDCALPPEPSWGKVDIFVAQRTDQPSFRPLWDVLGEHGRDAGLYRVYEIDDDPFSLDPVNWLARQRYTDGDIQDTIAHFASTADLVTVTTQRLAAVFREYSANVAVLPNYIPRWLLTLQRPRHERVTVGWAGGVSHARDIALIAQTWRDVTDETGCRSVFTGADFRTITRPHGFEHTPWEPEMDQYYRAIDFDIGLAPLSDHPFNLGKSPLKALEYAALGIPVIASDHPVYRDFVVDGVTGFLCADQQQWREAMRLLIADAGLRESMGAKAREAAAAWTIEGNWHRWRDAYRQLIKRSRT